MPLYDFICIDCSQPFDIFMTYTEYGTRLITCPHCQGSHVRRRLPRIRVARTETDRVESMAGDLSNPDALEGLEKDPRAMGRLMRKMGNELGEEIPPEFDEVVDRLEKGQSPEQIEKDLPGMAGEGVDDD